MIFAGDTRPSENCLTAVQAQLQTRTQNQQNIYEVNAQGGLFELPAGQVRAAVGFQFRENRAQFIPDILQSTSSFADQVVGVYPTGYMDARILTRDTYAELLIPILRDQGLKNLELEFGGRYSNYSATDSTFTYKVALNAELNDWFRLRGGYNRATRAPNLGELFLATQEIFTVGGNFGDPCGLRSNAPYSAAGAIDPLTGEPYPDPQVGAGETDDPQLAPGQTQAGADSAYLICQAMMGGPGSNAMLLGLALLLAPRAARATRDLWRRRMGDGLLRFILALLPAIFLPALYFGFVTLLYVEYMGLGPLPPVPSAGMLLQEAQQHLLVTPLASAATSSRLRTMLAAVNPAAMTITSPLR